LTAWAIIASYTNVVKRLPQYFLYGNPPGPAGTSC